MKILYLTDQYKPEAYTGTIKVVENIAENFAKDNEVKIVAYSDNIGKEYLQFESIKYWNETVDSISCIKFSTEDKDKINYQFYNEEIYKFAIKVIKDFDPDIIHICHLKRVASFIQAAIDLDKKYIITCTDTFLVCANSFLFDNSCNLCIDRHKDGICSKKCGYDDEIIRINKEYAKKYVENAYAFVGDSDFQIDIFSEYFNKEALVIHHGNKVNNEYVKEQKYPKDKLVFDYHGNSSAIKGLIVAIGAFNRLPSNINVELRVYGNCDDTVKILAGDKIKFLGRYNNKDVSKILSEADFLICPSICYENYPFVITEAFMNRTPVIASNEGGMKTLVKNCINGFTFNRADIEHLSSIIEYIFYNQNSIPVMINNLSDFSCKTIEEEIDEYKKLYDDLKNNQSINVERQNNIELMWKNIIENKFKFNTIEKYIKAIKYASLKYNYPINIDMQYRFVIRLKNVEKMLNEKEEKSIAIWGSGMSAQITIEILKKLYNWIEIKYIIDKFKDDGEIQQIPIVNVYNLDTIKFEYLFICTSPGKIEADETMKKQGKKLNIDYNYGICVE